MLAGFFIFALSEVGARGGIGEGIGTTVGGIFMATGILNAVLYMLYRLADYWHEHD